ncbi:hypothetical protein ACMYYO_07335 [Dermacoccaceae bacterium W4C1]
MKLRLKKQSAALDADDAERVRRRVQGLINISSRVSKYRDGLQDAAKHLSEHEATIIADLEQHGLDVAQLKEVLWGGHVLVDDPDLYEKWRFPESRERLSSHHKQIDKKEFPDLGFKGPLVREKLHGRTKTGTWVQLEKTPASMGQGFHLPSYHDVLHLWDFIVYRVTKSNVGPWGLSKQTERRPMYLAPAIATAAPVPEFAQAELLDSLEILDDSDDVTSPSPDLARLFPPPDRVSTVRELVFQPGTRNGRGLFGASDVHIKVVPRSSVHEQMRVAATARESWDLPDARHTSPLTVDIDDREIKTVTRRLPRAEQEEDS